MGQQHPQVAQIRNHVQVRACSDALIIRSPQCRGDSSPNVVTWSHRPSIASERQTAALTQTSECERKLVGGSMKRACDTARRTPSYLVIPDPWTVARQRVLAAAGGLRGGSSARSRDFLLAAAAADRVQR